MYWLEGVLASAPTFFLELIQTATIQFDLGEGGAMAVIYATIVVVVAWLFFSRIIPSQSMKSQEGT